MSHYVTVHNGVRFRHTIWDEAKKVQVPGALHRKFDSCEEADAWEQLARRWIVPPDQLNSVGILGTDGGFHLGKNRASWGWVLLLAPNWDVVDSGRGICANHCGQRNVAGEFAAVIHGLRACQKRGIFATVVHDYIYVAGEVLGTKKPSKMAQEYRQHVLSLEAHCAGFLWTPGHQRGPGPIILANNLADEQAKLAFTDT